MQIVKYVKFNGFNFDEIKSSLPNLLFKINQIREADYENKIPRQFEYFIQFTYLGDKRELELNINDYIIEIKDKNDHLYYNVIHEKTFNYSKKYLHIK